MLVCFLGVKFKSFYKCKQMPDDNKSDDENNKLKLREQTSITRVMGCNWTAISMLPQLIYVL